jgi:hypothetical protein
VHRCAGHRSYLRDCRHGDGQPPLAFAHQYAARSGSIAPQLQASVHPSTSDRWWQTPQRTRSGRNSRGVHTLMKAPWVNSDSKNLDIRLSTAAATEPRNPFIPGSPCMIRRL